MRALALALALLAAAPVPAAACHRFSVWNFPWPQKCGAAPASPQIRTAKAPPRRPVVAEVPMPALAPVDWGEEADERMRALALLRLRLAEERR